MKTPRGFTLIEMLTVLAIALTMVALTVPIFGMATKTVGAVQRKLTIYASARNVLDTFEAEARLAISNERGGHFSIKKLAFQDSDPFTPQESFPDTKKYVCSRREADCLNLVQLQPGGYEWTGKVGSQTVPVLPGAQPFPLAYPNNWGRYAEGWRVELTSSLSYQTPSVVDVDQDEGGSAKEVTDQLADVSGITTPVHSYAICNYIKDNCITEGYPSSTRLYDEVYDQLGPGKEIKNARRAQTEATVPSRQHYRGVSGIRVMDLDIAYWDDAQRKFLNVPDARVVYFAPPPKAVRFTITVCDREKRYGSITLQRVVYLPAGHGQASVQTTDDNFYYNYSASGSNPANPCKATSFNRTKRIKNLPPIYIGDWVWDAGDGNATVAPPFSEAPVGPADPGVFGTMRLWPSPPLPLNW